MGTLQAAGRPATAIPRPELHRAGKLCLVFLALLGLGALAGGIALVSKPDGSVMHFETSLLAGSPFADFTVPGLILGGLFGLGSLVIVALGLAHVRLAPFLAFAVGCAQMVWIVVELVIIKELSVLHPTFFGIGLVIAATAVPWGWPTFEAWRAARRRRAAEARVSRPPVVAFARHTTWGDGPCESRPPGRARAGAGRRSRA